MKNKIKGMSKKRRNVLIIIGSVIMIIAAFLLKPLVLQYKWSNQVIDAVLDIDKQKMFELLKDKNKNINYEGRGNGGKATPLEVACLQSYVPVEFVKILIDNGAKVTQKDYSNVTYGFHDKSYEKIKLLLKTGLKPKIVQDDNLDTILDDIAIAGLSLGYSRMSENYYLKAFKLIYYNAEPFDKKPALKSALKSAKLAKNKPLIKFIESELAKLDNK